MTYQQFKRAKYITTLQSNVTASLDEIKKKALGNVLLMDYQITKEADEQIRKIMIEDLEKQLSELQIEFEKI